MILYDLPGCPYCQMVKDKLQALQVSYERVIVPAEHSERQRVKQVSGQTFVPVLVDGEVVIDDENDIIDYLEGKYGK